VASQVVRHRADLQHREQVADAAILDELRDLIDDGVDAADDRSARLHQLLEGDLVQPRRDAEVARVAHDRLDPADVDVARQRERRSGDRAQAVAEVRLEVLAVEPLGLGVGVGDADGLQEGEPVGVLVAALLLGDLPEAVEDPLAGERRAEPAQIGEDVLALEHVGERARRAPARHPYGRSRLLHGTRPDVHGRVAGVLAVPGERLGVAPRPLEQLAALLGAEARLDRRDAAVPIRVVAEPDRQPGDQSPGAQHVEDRVLLGDLERLTGLAERSPEHRDRRIEALDLCRVGDDRGREVRVRRDVVGGLAVLADHDAVVPAAGRVQQLLDIGVDRLVHLLRLDQVVGGRDHRGVVLGEPVRQVAVGRLPHVEDLHCSPSSWLEPSVFTPRNGLVDPTARYAT